MRANKDTLIDSVTKALDGEFLREDIKFATECLFSEVTNSLIDGDRIEIRGFGSFSQRFRLAPKDPRENYSSGTERLKYKILYFRMSQNMNDKLNGK